MTRHRIAQIGKNRNPKSPENRLQTRRFLQIRLLQLRRSATPFNALAVLHGRPANEIRAAECEACAYSQQSQCQLCNQSFPCIVRGTVESTSSRCFTCDVL